MDTDGSFSTAISQVMVHTSVPSAVVDNCLTDTHVSRRFAGDNVELMIAVIDIK